MSTLTGNRRMFALAFLAAAFAVMSLALVTPTAFAQGNSLTASGNQTGSNATASGNQTSTSGGDMAQGDPDGDGL